jgi:hypothetical protein
VNWQTLGSIGEFVGGIGVIVTLIYVARQIRANTTAMRQEAEREAFDGNRLVLSQIARDRDVARILRIGLAGTDALDPDEEQQLAALLLQLTYDWLRLHSVDRDLTVGAALADANRRARREISSSPGYRRWFDARRHWFPEEFQKVLEEDMASGLTYMPFSSVPPGDDDS